MESGASRNLLITSIFNREIPSLIFLVTPIFLPFLGRRQTATLSSSPMPPKLCVRFCDGRG